MTTEVLIFGQLTDITAAGKLQVEDAADTNSLLEKLKAMYPALAAAKFVVAVNNKVIKENTSLSQSVQVALLPPFSGG
jgi:molybdopterin synthase sulfur carrier subunit